MIDIKIFTKDLDYIGFESMGHADYSQGEYDIVCAGVSVLTQTLYFHLIDNYNVNLKNIVAEQRSGYLKIILKNNIDIINVQDAFKFMIKGLEILEAQYSKHLKLETMEVQ